MASRYHLLSKHICSKTTLSLERIFRALSKLRLKDPVLQLSLTYQLSRQMRVSNSRPISTPWLNTLLCLHLAPINPVVFRGSITKINLKACFPLICFQRLSVPNVATRQCPWQDSRYTRGSSAPVFSY